MTVELSVVIPCLNEEATVGLCIEKALKCLKDNNISGEIVISDNGSVDNSVEIVKSFNLPNVKVIHCCEKGYGNALRTGFQSANGKYILMGDADDTYDMSKINEFYSKAISDENISMVIGSRFRGGIEKGAMPFLHKYLGNPVITILINLLFGTKITDSQCGMRLFKKSDFEKIKFKSDGMEFASDIIIEFSKRDMKIAEIPTTLSKDKVGRKPHLRTFSDGYRVIKFILQKRFCR